MNNLLKTGSILMLVMVLAFAFDGCKKEEEKVLPTASFTYAPADIVQYDEVQFTSTSTDTDSYLWDFGNSLTSTDANPKVQFMTAGTVTVKLTATNGDGSNTTEQTITVNAPDNHYMLDDTKIAITDDAPFFWYQASMGGDPYLRCISAIAGQDNPDLIKLYPNKGLGDLARTYTWSDGEGEGTYNHGYTANYAGMQYDWTAIGKTGSSDLVIEELETAVYKISGDMILSVGTYDWETGEFTETGTKTLTITYIGAITPLP